MTELDLYVPQPIMMSEALLPPTVSHKSPRTQTPTFPPVLLTTVVESEKGE